MDDTTWIFAAGDEAPHWLLVPINCRVTFAWPAMVVAGSSGWEVYPTEPVAAGSFPFVLRSFDERERAVAVPTRRLARSDKIWNAGPKGTVH
jgi:hypothetical protein